MGEVGGAKKGGSRMGEERTIIKKLAGKFLGLSGNRKNV